MSLDLSDASTAMPTRYVAVEPETTCRRGHGGEFAPRATGGWGARLVFEVSEPDRAAWATCDADAMMDDLEARYPDE